MDQENLCLRCGYSSTHKPNLTRHLKKKNPCKVKYMDIPTNILLSSYDQCYKSNITRFKKQLALGEPVADSDKAVMCDTCYEVLKNKSNMYYHTKHKCSTNKHVDGLSQTVNIYNNNYTTNNTTNNNIINIILKPNDYNKVDTSFITTEMIAEHYHLLHEVFIEVLKRVYVEHAKNRSVLISDLEESYGKVFRDNAWRDCLQNVIADELFISNYALIEDRCDGKIDKNNDVAVKFIKAIRSLKTNPENNAKVKRKMMRLLYDNRSIIQKSYIKRTGLNIDGTYTSKTADELIDAEIAEELKALTNSNTNSSENNSINNNTNLTL